MPKSFELCLAGPPTFFALAGIRQFFHCFWGVLLLRWIRELRLCGAAKVRYCLVVPTRKHLMAGLVPLSPFCSTSFRIFLSVQARNVLTLQVTSFKLDCWPSSQAESETPQTPLLSPRLGPRPCQTDVSTWCSLYFWIAGA
jgi:hypothetical protein